MNIVKTLRTLTLVLIITLPLLAAPPPQSASAATWAEQTLSRMSLREKVGQMFIPYVYGQSAYDTSSWAVSQNRKLYGVSNAAQLIQKYHVGGIIYFTWTGNMNNPRQIATLSNGIQHAALVQRVPVPLLISTDQEQGIIYRLPPPVTAFPSNMAIGATRHTTYAYTAAHITGQEMRALGLNQNFAPDADVNVNPKNPVIGVRSFGSYSPMVSSMVAQQVQGLQSAGVAATAKHFPGHGDTDVDSHTGLPVIHHTLRQINTIDLPPFRAAIAAHADCIMTAHIVVPALDSSGRPATLSKRILTGLLRDRLGFRGVIVTDSLQMAGVRQMFPDSEVPIQAINAGADMMLMPPNLGLAISSVVNAVNDGRISRQRINQSVLRILTLKAKLGLPKHPYVDPDAIPGTVGTRAHATASANIANHSITLVRNAHGILPLPRGSGWNVLVTGWGVQTTTRITQGLDARGLRAHRLWTGANPSSTQIAEAVSAARRNRVVIVTTQNVEYDSGQQRLVRALISTGRPVVVASVEHPYDIAYFPSATAYLATYGYDTPSVLALVRVLTGNVNPSGKLPVRIPALGGGTLYPYGHGIRYPEATGAALAGADGAVHLGLERA